MLVKLRTVGEERHAFREVACPTGASEELVATRSKGEKVLSNNQHSCDDDDFIIIHILYIHTYISYLSQ